MVEAKKHIKQPGIQLNTVIMIVVIAIVVTAVATIKIYKTIIVKEEMTESTNEQVTSMPQTQSQNQLPGPQSFKGTLPCADCSGIMTELTLQKNSDDPTEGEYVLKQTYQGKSTQPVITLGKWNRDPSQNSASIVISLENADKVVFQNWQVIDNDTLKMLDVQKNEIKSPFNLLLKRE